MQQNVCGAPYLRPGIYLGKQRYKKIRIFRNFEDLKQDGSVGLESIAGPQ